MRALILVDLQNDFLPGGSLAVPHGDDVIPIANRMAQEFECVIATQDWHPANHCSFADNQQNPGTTDAWPVHCVQGSPGAKLSDKLGTDRIQQIVKKGVDPRIDSYSGFFDNDHQTSTGLNDYLHQLGVTDVFVMGLATDYCVKATALDAARLGYKVSVIIDGCRGVDIPPGSVNRALKELSDAGVALIQSDQMN